MRDEDLLRAFVQNRSRSAFEELFRRHGGMVYAVCRRALGDAQEAEDAAQSVFLLLLEKAPQLGHGIIVGAWLYRTAVYVTRNRIRARIRRETRPPPAAAPSSEPAWGEAKPHLDDALARLPRKLQDALVLHYLQGKTLSETAKALDCPVKTIEKRVGRGLERMREFLGGAGVAISSAALVALLQSEAHAAAPARMTEALRACPIPRAAVPSRLGLAFKNLLPLALAGLVVVAFIAGSLRYAAIGRDRSDSGPVRSLSGSESAGRTAGSGAIGGPPPAAPLGEASTRRFPATFEEFSTCYRNMRACPEAIDRWTALGIGLRPEELRRAAGRAPDDDVDGVILEIFKEWSRREPRASADWLYQACAILPASEGWRPARPQAHEEAPVTLPETILENWFSRDAAEVEAWIKSLPAGSARDVVAAEAGIVGVRHPEARIDFLASLVDELPLSWARHVAVIRMSRDWARRDPKAAAAWVLKLPPPDPNQVDVREATFRLDQPDPDPGLLPFATVIEQESTEAPETMIEARLSALYAIARAWAASDLEGARQWCENLPNSVERTRTMGALGEIWTASDLDAALHYARAHPGAAWRDGWLETMATTLAPTDRAAAEAIARLSSDAEQPTLLARVLTVWGESRPAEAAPEVVRAMSELHGETAFIRFNDALWTLSRAWVRRDPARAAEWAAAIESEQVRLLAVGSVACHWASSDPRAALNWTSTLPPGSCPVSGFRSIAVSLGEQDPELALKVLDRLKPEEGCMSIRYLVATSWGKLAPDAAIAWARSLAPDAGRDSCILSVLQGWAGQDPDAAGAQVGSIVDEEVKAQALQNIEERRREAEREKVRKSLLRQEP